MKKLHKKVGAMALASMVVAGGVAASGVQSHAVSFLAQKPEVSVKKEGLNALSPYARVQYNFIEDYIKDGGGKIVKVSQSQEVMDKHISDSERFRKSVKKELLKLPNGWHSGEDVKNIIKQKKSQGLRFYRFRFSVLDILVYLR